MIEYVTGGLVVAVVGILGWVYKRGRASGIDAACEENIKKEIKAVALKVDKSIKDGDRVHGELKKEVGEVKVMLGEVKGSLKVIQEIVSGHVNKGTS